MKTKLHLDREGKTKNKLCTQLPAREREGGERRSREPRRGEVVNGCLFICRFPHPVNGCKRGHPFWKNAWNAPIIHGALWCTPSEEPLSGNSNKDYMVLDFTSACKLRCLMRKRSGKWQRKSGWNAVDELLAGCLLKKTGFNKFVLFYAESKRAEL